MFLRLNRLFIPEVKALHDAIEANKAAAARCKEKVAQVKGAIMANTALVVNLLICSVVVYSMDVLNCRFADIAVDLCPCGNIIPYETVVCKGGHFL